uniref:Uncharacterized protein n=1 Tax=Anguilla anguilla TaxID=7936 RepID=A0A0E9WBP1_ANGAN
MNGHIIQTEITDDKINCAQILHSAQEMHESNRKSQSCLEIKGRYRTAQEKPLVAFLKSIIRLQIVKNKHLNRHLFYKQYSYRILNRLSSCGSKNGTSVVSSRPEFFSSLIRSFIFCLFPLKNRFHCGVMSSSSPTCMNS